MAQFDVHLNPEGEGWLVDVQADELSTFRTTIVAPLVLHGPELHPVKRLNPLFATTEGDAVLLTHLLFAIPRRILPPASFNLSDHQDVIKSSLDMAIYGF